ncbi:MAG: hypothetical protein JWO46_94 [Nocardioidaceae bacterium]|nr:hypothetical protein [Nocardioidaceae bacterium]
MATVRARSARTWGAGLFALFLLAGCGQQSGSAADDSSTSPSPSSGSSSATADAAAQPWLLRYESYSGEDGETKTATYVSLVPSTGKATTVKLPQTPVSEVGSNGRLLLVDAAHRWALGDVQPARAQTKSGTITLYDLEANGAPVTLDVRAATGDAALKTKWASFDPTTPGLLRVVSGQQVWKVDVNAKTAVADAPLPTFPADDWIYAGGFDKNSGMPYVEAIDTNETVPSGNGADDSRAVERGGGQVLTFDGGDTSFGDRPSPGCDVAVGYIDADQGAWAFCIDGSSVSVKQLAKGASDWTDVGASVAGAAPDDGDPVFVLPPATKAS